MGRRSGGNRRSQGSAESGGTTSNPSEKRRSPTPPVVDVTLTREGRARVPKMDDERKAAAETLEEPPSDGEPAVPPETEADPRPSTSSDTGVGGAAVLNADCAASPAPLPGQPIAPDEAARRPGVLEAISSALDAARETSPLLEARVARRMRESGGTRDSDVSVESLQAKLDTLEYQHRSIDGRRSDRDVRRLSTQLTAAESENEELRERVRVLEMQLVDRNNTVENGPGTPESAVGRDSALVALALSETVPTPLAAGHVNRQDTPVAGTDGDDAEEPDCPHCDEYMAELEDARAERDDIASTAAALNEECDRLRAMSKDTSGEVRALEGKVSGLLEEVSRKSNALRMEEHARGQAEAERDAALARVADLEASVSAVNEEDLEKALRRAEKLETEIAQMHAAESENRTHAEERERQLAHELNQSRANSADLSRTVEELKASLQDAMDADSARTATLQKEHEATVRMLKAEVVSLQDALALSQKGSRDDDALRDEVEGGRRRIIELEETVAELREALSRHEECENVRESLEAVVAELEDRNSECERYHNANAKLLRDLDSLKTATSEESRHQDHTIATLKRDWESSQAQIKSLSETLRKERERVEILEAKYSVEKAEMEADHDTEMSRLVDQTDRSIARLRSELREREQQLAASEATRHKCEEDMTRMSEEWTTQRESLEKSISVANETSAQRKQMLDALEARIDAVAERKERHSEGTELGVQTQTMARRDSGVQTETGGLEQVEHLVQSLADTEGELRKQRRLSQEEKETTDEIIRELRSHITRLEEQCRSLEGKLADTDNLDTAHAVLTSELASLKKKVAMKQELIEENSGILERYKDTLEQIREENERLTQAMEEYQGTRNDASTSTDKPLEQAHSALAAAAEVTNSAQISALSRRLVEEQTRADDLTQKNEELTAAVERARIEAARIVEEAGAREKDALLSLLRVTKDRNDLDNQQQSMSRQSSELTERLGMMTLQMDALRKHDQGTVMTLEQTIQALQADVKTLNAQNADLQNTLRLLSGRAERGLQEKTDAAEERKASTELLRQAERRHDDAAKIVEEANRERKKLEEELAKEKMNGAVIQQAALDVKGLAEGEASNMRRRMSEMSTSLDDANRALMRSREETAAKEKIITDLTEKVTDLQHQVDTETTRAAEMLGRFKGANEMLKEVQAEAAAQLERERRASFQRQNELEAKLNAASDVNNVHKAEAERCRAACEILELRLSDAEFEHKVMMEDVNTQHDKMVASLREEIDQLQARRMARIADAEAAAVEVAGALRKARDHRDQVSGGIELADGARGISPIPSTASIRPELSSTSQTGGSHGNTDAVRNMEKQLRSFEVALEEERATSRALKQSLDEARTATDRSEAEQSLVAELREARSARAAIATELNKQISESSETIKLMTQALNLRDKRISKADAKIKDLTSQLENARAIGSSLQWDSSHMQGSPESRHGLAEQNSIRSLNGSEVEETAHTVMESLRKAREVRNEIDEWHRDETAGAKTMRRKVVDLEAEVAAQIERIAGVSAENSSLKSQLQDAIARCVRYEAEVDTAPTDVIGKLSRVEHELALKNAELAQANAEHSSSRRRNSVLRRELQTAQEEILSLRHEITMKRHDLEEQRIQLAQAKMTSDFGSVTSGADNEAVTRLQNELEQARSELKQARADLAKHSTRTALAEQARESAEARAADSENKLQASVKVIAEQTARIRRDNGNQNPTEMRRLMETEMELHGRVATLQRELLTACRTIDHMRTEARRGSGDKVEDRAEKRFISELERQVEQTEANLRKIREARASR